MFPYQERASVYGRPRSIKESVMAFFNQQQFTAGTNEGRVLEHLRYDVGLTAFELHNLTALTVEEVRRALARLTAERLAYLSQGTWKRRPTPVNPF